MQKSLFASTLRTSAAVAAIVAVTPAHSYQQRFQVGDRVECSNYSDTGPWDPGTVVDYTPQDRQLDPRGVQSGRFYRVNLDKYPAFLNPATCMAAYTRPAGAASTNRRGANGGAGAQGRGGAGAARAGSPPRVSPPAGNARQAQAQPGPNGVPRPGAAPAAAGGPAPRDLRGTAWKLQSPGSMGVQVYRFCRNGRWEVVGSRPVNGAVGTYRQSGGSLTTRNQDDGMVTTWSLRWPGGDRMDINDGRVTLPLRYNGTVSC